MDVAYDVCRSAQLSFCGSSNIHLSIYIFLGCFCVHFYLFVAEHLKEMCNFKQFFLAMYIKNKTSSKIAFTGSLLIICFVFQYGKGFRNYSSSGFKNINFYNFMLVLTFLLQAKIYCLIQVIKNTSK